MIRTCALVIAIGLAATACRKHDDPPPPPATTTPAAPVVKQLTMESSTMSAGGLTVTAQHPAGWSQTVLAASVHVFTDPTPSLAFPSTMMLGAGCFVPPCGAPPEDAATVAAAMAQPMASDAGVGPDVQTRPIADGFEIEISGMRPTGPVHVYARELWRAGWSAEATCLAVTADTLIAHHQQLDDACRAMTADPTPAPAPAPAP